MFIHAFVQDALRQQAALQSLSQCDQTYSHSNHVNGSSSGSLKFVAILTNLGTAPGTLTVQQKGIAGPTTSYLYAGKVAFQRWLNSVPLASVSVGASASVELDSSLTL